MTIREQEIQTIKDWLMTTPFAQAGELIFHSILESDRRDSQGFYDTPSELKIKLISDILTKINPSSIDSMLHFFSVHTCPEFVSALFKTSDGFFRLLPFFSASRLKDLAKATQIENSAVQDNVLANMVYRLSKKEDFSIEMVRTTYEALLALPEACEAGDVEQVKQLMEICVSVRNKYGYFPNPLAEIDESWRWNPMEVVIKLLHMELLTFFIACQHPMEPSMRYLFSQAIAAHDPDTYKRFVQHYLDVLSEEVLLLNMPRHVLNEVISEYYLNRFSGMEDEIFTDKSFRSEALQNEQRELTAAIFRQAPLRREDVEEVYTYHYGYNNDYNEATLMDLAVLHHADNAVLAKLINAGHCITACGWVNAIALVDDAGDDEEAVVEASRPLAYLINLHKQYKFLPEFSLLDGWIITPIYYASSINSLIAMMLILQTAKVDFYFEEAESNLPILHYAAGMGSFEQVKMLLEQGALIRPNSKGVLPSQCVPASDEADRIELKTFLMQEEAKVSYTYQQIHVLTEEVCILKAELHDMKSLVRTLVESVASQASLLASLHGMVEQLGGLTLAGTEPSSGAGARFFRSETGRSLSI